MSREYNLNHGIAVKYTEVSGGGEIEEYNWIHGEEAEIIEIARPADE